MGVSFDKDSQTWMYKFEVQKRVHRRRGFRTERDATSAFTKAWRQAEETPATGEVVTFDQAQTAYLNSHRPPLLADSTHEKYTQQLGLMVKLWGPRQLKGITTADIETYRRWRLDHKVKGATVNRDLEPLSALFNWAKHSSRRWVIENPVTEIQRFDEPRITYQTVTPAERKTMWETLGDQAVKADLLHALGVRLGVVLRLKWEQVSFETRTIQYRSKGRDITRLLGPRAISILKGLDPKPTGWVFMTRSETPFRRAWDAARKAIKRPTLRPHDLRVTFAREMADAGVDPSTIRDMLGHSTLTMTMHYIGSSRLAQETATKLHDARAGFV